MRPVGSRCCLAALLVVSGVRASEAADFDVATYQDFLRAHADLSGAELEAMYPAAQFARYAPTDFAAAAYSDSVASRLGLSGPEQELIGRHGFVVTERLRPASFGAAFLDIYHQDLPVFISTDAILHALHMSYDAILVDLEQTWLRPRLEALLAQLHEQLAQKVQQGDQAAAMLPVWEDVDLYLTVPRRLLGQQVVPQFPANADRVAELLSLVTQEQPASVPLFGARRLVDFSQFTPRGHYTDEPFGHPGSAELTEYFKAMIWLGRIELYLRAPRGALPEVPEEVIRHQAAMAATLAELAAESGADAILAQIEGVLQALVGEQDNADLPQVRAALASQGAAELLEPGGLARLQTALEAAGAGSQRILSQMMIVNPFAGEPLEPPGAFLLLGQRFVIDSYMTGNVVYDRIRYREGKVFRGLPSSLDVLFALGNDAVVPLLRAELEQYHYATNLAGLRYLVDSFDAAFWQSSFYNGWLAAIRTLNPPASRQALPAFMRTGAWWQEKLNTQLAAWAQLRHDNLLYAKQSYTGIPVCSYPEGYVEPVPAFYDALQALAAGTAARLQALLGDAWETRPRVGSYFGGVAAVADTLAGIARKELVQEGLSPAERRFLETVLYDVSGGCAASYEGWYPRLYFPGQTGFLGTDLVVADVHTQPADEFGSLVGHVLHVGTGPVNIAVVVADRTDGVSTAFVGPVMSYYEHVSTNFDRLTDEEWQYMYAVAPSSRPDFVRLYLAGAEGELQAMGRQLPTAVCVQAAESRPVRPGLVLGQGYPNPFNSSVLVVFSVGPELAGEQLSLTVYNAAGQSVAHLVDRALPAGNYTARWDGTDDDGARVASGVYTCLLVGKDRQLGTRVSLVK